MVKNTNEYKKKYNQIYKYFCKKILTIFVGEKSYHWCGILSIVGPYHQTLALTWNNRHGQIYKDFPLIITYFNYYSVRA